MKTPSRAEEPIVITDDTPTLPLMDTTHTSPVVCSITYVYKFD